MNQHNDVIVEVINQLEELKVKLSLLIEPPVEEPPVEEPPVEEPPVEEPPVIPSSFEIQSRELNMSKLLQFTDWNTATRYTRFVRNVFLRKDRTSNIAFNINSHTSFDPLLVGEYRLVARKNGNGEPVELARVNCPGTSDRSSFLNVSFSALDNGWYWFDIVPSDETSDETCHPYWMYVGASEPQDFAPIITGSYGVTHEEGKAYWGKVPCVTSPKVFEYERRGTVVPFDYPVDARLLYRRNLSPCINGDPHYVRNIPHPQGGSVNTCMNSHAYAFSTLTSPTPQIIFRDGPYGFGLIPGATHLQVGRLKPDMDSATVYFADSGSIGKIEPNGDVKRMVGWRDTDQGRILVGDWSNVPESRRGFNLIWGFAWKTPTVSSDTLDTSRLVNRGDGVMENPHTMKPTLFVADSLTKNVFGKPGRIVKVEFAPDSHDTEPTVTEFITNSHNAWDVVYRNGLIYVSERRDHRIAAYSADTGELVDVIVASPDGDNFATVSRHDQPGLKSGVTLDIARNQECLLPEGLFIQDEWLYFGSIVVGQVKRVNLDVRNSDGTRIVEVVASWTPVSKSEYCKIAVSDGTFGPRGTVFVSTWEVQRMGFPWAFLPDGTSWNFYRTASRSVDRGRTTNGLAGLGYSTSVTVANGVLICAGADYGIAELRLAKDGDSLYDEDKYQQGMSAYDRKGYRLTHGISGFGQFGYDLPFGEDETIDYFLEVNGHKQT